MQLKACFSILLLITISVVSVAQTTVTGADQSSRVLYTAVPFLTISPDARHAGMGDAGVASTPDINGAYWNPGKMAFIEGSFGGSISFTPWLAKVADDMWISNLNGFYSLNDGQVFSGAIRYFNLGSYNARTDDDVDMGTFSSREMAIDFSYSRKLTNEFSVGLTGRYIYSNLAGGYAGANGEVQAVHSAAVDIGLYYSKTVKGPTNSTYALGVSITNIGPNVSYSGSNEDKDPIPTNFRIGGSYRIEMDMHNSFTFLLDLNKLLVPTQPIYQTDNAGNIVLDPNGDPVIDKGKDPSKSMLSGMLGSFNDAPNGVSEEMSEVIINAGIEYWYKKLFAARTGVFYESKDKGNRQYVSLGLGFTKTTFGLDAAYLVPFNGKENPLFETFRFTLHVSINKKQ